MRSTNNLDVPVDNNLNHRGSLRQAPLSIKIIHFQMLKGKQLPLYIVIKWSWKQYVVSCVWFGTINAVTFVLIPNKINYFYFGIPNQA